MGSISAWRGTRTLKATTSLMLALPSLIKRPVLDAGRRLLVGFKPETYASALRAAAGK